MLSLKVQYFIVNRLKKEAPIGLPTICLNFIF
jgi:hypothetical protein